MDLCQELHPRTSRRGSTPRHKTDSATPSLISTGQDQTAILAQRHLESESCEMLDGISIVYKEHVGGATEFSFGIMKDLGAKAKA